MNTGKVSILMGIYNCASTLEDAVASILAQTYTNWELILCDDGSSDDTFAVASRLAAKDSRIILLRNAKNCGLNKTLNNCLTVATGEFIARMDGDDTCSPDRFSKQVAFLRSQTDYQIVSSWMSLFDETGEWGITQKPESPKSGDVVSGSPICHAPVMMYKYCMDAVGGYTEDKRMIRVEDVNLWIKLYAAGFRCYNIQEPLYQMRNDRAALSRRKYRYRINSTYVRLKGCQMLHLSWKYYVLSFKPMIAGLVPARLRQIIRKQQRGVK